MHESRNGTYWRGWSSKIGMCMIFVHTEVWNFQQTNKNVFKRESCSYSCLPSYIWKRNSNARICFIRMSLGCLFCLDIFFKPLLQVHCSEFPSHKTQQFFSTLPHKGWVGRLQVLSFPLKSMQALARQVRKLGQISWASAFRNFCSMGSLSQTLLLMGMLTPASKWVLHVTTWFNH